MTLIKQHVRVQRVAAAVAAVGLATILAVPLATAAPDQAPVLSWVSCDDGFQCATAPVPLDYRHPDGTKISIAVVRHLATDPAERIGSLFINAGGPNEQIEGFVTSYQKLPAVLRERFDVMTFDPRGFGYSTAIRCFPTMAAEQQFLSGLPAFPVGAKQEATWERTFATFDARCAERNGPLLDHDTTADVARDMNLIRQAVGDPVLNYVGLSYGSGLGATYANLFPATVGRMILDGNVNPVAWTTQAGSLTSFLRLGTDEASAADMTAFLNLCGRRTTAACAFSAGTPAATRDKWDTLLRRLTSRPSAYADAITTVDLGVVTSWQSGATQLQQLWLATAGSTSAATVTGTATSAPAVYTGLEQNRAVFCSDSPNPRNPGAYADDDKLAYSRSGGFGLEWLWDTEVCAQWPGNGAEDRYTGPWNRPTAGTILLLGNTGDPLLPYQDTLAMAHDLARARVLTVAGYGHTEESNPSTCALNYELGYLQTGALPAAGTVCRENATPFGTP